MNPDNSPPQPPSGSASDNPPSANGVFALPQVSTGPNSLCPRFLHDLARRFGIRTFVQTSTCLGGTAEAGSEVFEEVHSIEPSAELARQAIARLAARKNVRVYQGDSSELLPQILKGLSGPTLFWLDGGQSTGRTARGDVNSRILDELLAIKESGLKDPVILISDLRLFGTPTQTPVSSSAVCSYPDITALHQAVLAIDSRLQFLVLGEVALACPSGPQLPPSPVVMAVTLSRMFDGQNLSIDEVLEAEHVLASAQGQERDLIRALWSECSAVDECPGVTLTLGGDRRTCYWVLVVMSTPAWVGTERTRVNTFSPQPNSASITGVSDGTWCWP